LDDLEHLARGSVPAQSPLGEHELTVHRDFVYPARGLDELDVGVLERFLDLGRQTGSPWLVTSDPAVLDRDAHTILQKNGKSTKTNLPHGGWVNADSPGTGVTLLTVSVDQRSCRLERQGRQS
jgi:hypothetical protein